MVPPHPKSVTNQRGSPLSAGGTPVVELLQAAAATWCRCLGTEATASTLPPAGVIRQSAVGLLQPHLHTPSRTRQQTLRHDNVTVTSITVCVYRALCVCVPCTLRVCTVHSVWCLYEPGSFSARPPVFADFASLPPVEVLNSLRRPSEDFVHKPPSFSAVHL